MGLIIGFLVICAIFVVLFTKILFKDLSKYFWFETINILKGFKKGDNNIGDLFTTYAIAGLIGFLSFLFLKAILTLSAYLLSGDLIEFFIINRGVFTSDGVELQNPYLLKNIVYGLFITPIAQFFSVYVMIRTLQTFMSFINTKVGRSIFDISDLVYFSAISCLSIVILDVFVYYQSITVVNTFSNIALQIGAKFAYLLYFFSILHLVLLKRDSYLMSLSAEINYSIIKKKVLSNPKILVPVIFIIGVLLQLPLYSGFQFGSNEWLMIFQLIIVGALLYFVLRFTCAKGFNYIGVYLIDESRNMEIEDYNSFTLLQKKWFKYSLGCILLMLLIIIPKSLFLFLFFMILFSLIVIAVTLSLYSAGTFFSRIRFDWYACRNMFGSLRRAILPIILLLFFVFIALSFAPKKLKSQEFTNYQTNAVDNAGHLLYKAPMDNNPSSPIKFDEIPEFFVRALVAKEDRGFMNQKDLMINKSNWHGISITGHSNLTQQLIKNLAFNGRFPQEIQRKLTEFTSSYQLSIQSTPNDILSHYVNNVSFNGGKNHKGIVNASFYTFGKNVMQLNELEMIYLLNTLHRGNNFKVNDNQYIDYSDVHLHSTLIKERLLKIASIWEQNGLISSKELKKIKRQSLKFTNSTYRLNALASSNSFYVNEIKDKPDEFVTYQTSVSMQKQVKTNEAVKVFFEHFNNHRIKNGNELYAAALIVDVKTGNIIAHYGGEGVSELAHFKNGNPMGSVIKPFVLLQLLENGYAIRLYDGKRPNFRVPNNYNNRNSNKYKNVITILGPSLNTPMGNIYEITDPIKLFSDVEKRFTMMGIQNDKFLNLSDPNKKVEHRINYPIGSRNMTLFDIAQAYQTLFNNGKCKKLSLFTKAFNPFTLKSANFENNSIQVYDRRNIYQIQNALKSVLEIGGTGYSLNNYLPKNVQFMGKTGTTDQYKHGYTILSDSNTLVVSWVSYGKKENGVLKLGQAEIPNKSGGGSAGVLAAFIFNELYK